MAMKTLICKNDGRLNIQPLILSSVTNACNLAN